MRDHAEDRARETGFKCDGRCRRCQVGGPAAPASGTVVANIISAATCAGRVSCRRLKVCLSHHGSPLDWTVASVTEHTHRPGPATPQRLQSSSPPYRPAVSERRAALIRTADGSKSGSFGPAEWSMLGFLAVVWGASFLLIAIGLDAFTPGMVAWLRLIVAVLVLSALPAVRRSVDRIDWPAIAVVSIAGNAGPALLFAYAEQTIESSLAGMLNAAVPLATAAIAFLLGVRSLRQVHVLGLVLGFAGVVLLGLPSSTGSESGAIGVLLVLLAVFGYALTGNVLVPLQQKYGALPVIYRAQALGVLLVASFWPDQPRRQPLRTGAIRRGDRARRGRHRDRPLGPGHDRREDGCTSRLDHRLPRAHRCDDVGGRVSQRIPRDARTGGVHSRDDQCVLGESGHPFDRELTSSLSGPA